MYEDLARQFLGSDIGRNVVQAVTSQLQLPTDQAQNAIRATAEGGAEALRGGSFDLGTLLGGGGVLGGIADAFGLGGKKSAGGLPTELVTQVSDYVANKTGLSASVVTAVVAMALPKVLEFAKAMIIDRGTSPPA